MQVIAPYEEDLIDYSQYGKEIRGSAYVDLGTATIMGSDVPQGCA